MNNKADVKAIMARFQASGASTEETSSTPAGRPKQLLQPTLSSGFAAQKKPALESISGSAVNVSPKPTFLKSTVSSKSDMDTQETSKTKVMANRFANNRDDSSINSKPFIGSKPSKPSFSQASEVNLPVQKPPFSKPPLASTLSGSKPALPKPSPGVASKPSWVKEDSGGGGSPSNKSPTPPKMPGLQQKPSSTLGKLRQQNEDPEESSTDTVKKPSTPATSGFKPTSNFKTAQNMFNKDKDKDETDSGGTSKPALTAKTSFPTPPPASKKPSLKKHSKSSLPSSGVNEGAPSGPKRKTLTNSLALGSAPAKPNRPPKVNLDSFKRRAETSDDRPTFKKSTVPPPPTSHPSDPSNKVTQSQAPPPAPPSLPPRHLVSMNQQEDFYDDVEELTSVPPPLPSSSGHPSQRAKEENDEDEDDGEMYQELDEQWEIAEKKQEKQKDKDEKEEKKRQEAEKKEQKEREKKEQDARKKFKLVGPLEVIHQGKAGADCKGGKSDLALKQGDLLDIIRVQGNPEGKWLGRMADGSIGYVKTTSVKIDFNTLKSHQVQQPYEPQVYDDIDVLSSDKSSHRSPGVVLPPLPGEGGEIYDDCVDLNLEVRVPPPSQFTEGSSDQPGASINEEIYDDIDSQDDPPPPLPPISSLPAMKLKGRGEEMDLKKQKKFEKEEKEFRKKFKYEGEIQVLYQVTVNHMATNKKWSQKDLPVKAGEKLDVIVKDVDNKLTCRNEDGKFGYVSTSHIVMDDGDIYDDIGDDNIYDND